MPTPPLSFTQAQYEGDPAPGPACAFCQRPLPGEYFRVGNHLACSTCAANAQALVPPDSHKAFVRATVFGVAAAILGCIGYATFEIATTIVIGYVAVAVGWLIGWAMKKGSNGIGGRRYQIVAAVLTYAAVAVAFVPVVIHQRNVEKHNQAAYKRDTGQSATGDQSSNANAAGGRGQQSVQKSPGIGTFFLGIGILLGFGLISPFLVLASSVPSGLINLFIIFIGIRFAWNSTAGKRVEVDGPFNAAG